MKETLEVEVVKTRILSLAERQKINSSLPKGIQSKQGSAGDPVRDNINGAVDENREGLLGQLEVNDGEVRRGVNDGEVRRVVNDGEVRSSSKNEWLFDFSTNFHAIVLGGLEAGMRDKVQKSINEKTQLRGKENQAVINSCNHHIYKYIGKQRPDKALCR